MSVPASQNNAMRQRQRTRTLDQRRQALGVAIYVILNFMLALMIFSRLIALAFSAQLPRIFPGITPTQVGAFSAVYFYFYAPLQPFMGALTDRVGPRWLIVASAALFFVASLVVGLSPRLWGVFLGRALSGVAASAYVVPFTRILTLWFPPRQFILLLTVNKAINGVYSCLATVPLVYLVELIDARHPNKALMVFMCGLAAWAGLVGAAFAAVARDSPARAGYNPIAREDSLAERWAAVHGEEVRDMHVEEPGRPAESATHDAGPGAVARPRMTFREALRLTFVSRASAQLYMLLVAAMINQGTFFTVSSSIGIAWVRAATGRTGILPAVVQLVLFLVSIPGSFLFTFLSNRVGRVPVLRFMLASAVALYLLLGLVSEFYPGLWVYGVAFALLGLVMPPAGSVLTTVIKESYPIEVAGTVVGFYYFCTMLGGALFQNVVPAIITHSPTPARGYANVGYAFMGLNCVSTILSSFLRETRAGSRTGARTGARAGARTAKSSD